MQSAYISNLMELAERDSRVLHLVADNGTVYDDIFFRNFPGQFFNLGIAESNMVSVAAGLATTGKIPFIYTAGAFLTYRAIEFIRDDICFQNLNVKIIGAGSGLSLSSLGPTHHTSEDIAMLRPLPNLKILSPATPIEAGKCVRLAYEETGPIYVRLGMNYEKEYFEESHTVRLGKNEIVCEGSDLYIFVTGSILEEAMKASEILRKKGIDVGIVNMVSIKPFDQKNVEELSKKVKHFVTVEEHNVIGGIGSIIADVIAEKGLSVSLKKIGLNDCFAKGYGTYQSVRIENGLDAEAIADQIQEVFL